MRDKKPPFDLMLFTRAMQPLPYAVVNGTLILLSAIETAELAEDGSLMLCFTSGSEMTLPPNDAATLETILREALQRAMAAQAQQSARALGLITSPIAREAN